MPKISELTETTSPATTDLLPIVSSAVTKSVKRSNLIANDEITYAKMQNISAASRLLGRGSASGSGDPQEIAIGTGLVMSGTTLNATGGGGGPTGILDVTQSPYTADNTGVADSTSTIQDAIDDSVAAGGAIVYLPPGSYKVSGLTVTADNVIIIGAGMGVTFIKMSSVTGDTIATGSAMIQGLQVRGITFQPSVTRTKHATSNYEIRVQYYGAGSTQRSFVVLSDLEFINVNGGIFLGDGTHPSGRVAINNIHAWGFYRWLYMVVAIDIWITNCSIVTDTTDGRGIHFDGGCESVGISNMDIINVTGGASTDYAMVFLNNLWTSSTSRHCTFTNLYLDSFSYGLVGAHGMDISFTNCWMQGYDTGCLVGQDSDDYRFVNCLFYNSYKNGMRVDSTGRHLIESCSFIANNRGGQASSSPFSAGLYLNMGSNGVTRVVNCLSRMNASIYPTDIQEWGIWIANNSGTAYIIENWDVYGNNTGGINALATPAAAGSRLISECLGFLTSCSGAATIASGTTSIAVTHNLAMTPSAQQIQITPTNNPTNNVRHWVSAVSSTTFTVSSSGDPGASGLAFAWFAKLQ